jgi:hypothetical protein
MKAGDKVVLIGIPPNVPDDEEMRTRELFEKCLGKSFVIDAIEWFEGVPYRSKNYFELSVFRSQRSPILARKSNALR